MKFLLIAITFLTSFWCRADLVFVDSEIKNAVIFSKTRISNILEVEFCSIQTADIRLLEGDPKTHCRTIGEKAFLEKWVFVKKYIRKGFLLNEEYAKIDGSLKALNESLEDSEDKRVKLDLEVVRLAEVRQGLLAQQKRVVGQLQSDQVAETTKDHLKMVLNNIEEDLEENRLDMGIAEVEVTKLKTSVSNIKEKILGLEKYMEPIEQGLERRKQALLSDLGDKDSHSLYFSYDDEYTWVVSPLGKPHGNTCKVHISNNRRGHMYNFAGVTADFPFYVYDLDFNYLFENGNYKTPQLVNEGVRLTSDQFFSQVVFKISNPFLLGHAPVECSASKK